jgi:hypothetical protein
MGEVRKNKKCMTDKACYQVQKYIVFVKITARKLDIKDRSTYINLGTQNRILSKTPKIWLASCMLLFDNQILGVFDNNVNVKASIQPANIQINRIFEAISLSDLLEIIKILLSYIFSKKGKKINVNKPNKNGIVRLKKRFHLLMIKIRPGKKIPP